jgi:hypothetical protein
LAAFNGAVAHVIEAVSDEPDGTDLVSQLIGNHVDLAQALLDGWE